MRIPSHEKQTPSSLEKQTAKKIRLSDMTASTRIKYREKALQLFEKGSGYMTVAAKLKLSIYTVRDWYRLYRGGFFSADLKKPGNSSENHCSKDIKDEVREEFLHGSSVSSLSVKFGKSKSTIRYWLKPLKMPHEKQA